MSPLHATSESGTPAASTIDPAVARRAAQWLAHLYSEDAQPEDWHAFEEWCAAAPAHQAAWRQAEKISQQLGVIPRHIGAQPLISAATRSAVTRMSRRKFGNALALLILTAPVGVVGYQQLPWQAWRADERSATGQIRTLSLPDGSQLTLDTASAVDIAFDRQQRVIALHAGTILVQTAHHADARPLYVRSAAGRLQAMGTRFIARQQNDDRCQIQVLQGAVALQPKQPDAGATILRAGQQSTLTPFGAGPIQVLADYADSWANGVLYVESMRLDDFLREVSRYRAGIMRCDPAVAHLRVSGTFQLRQPDAILATLQAALPIAIHTRTRYWVSVESRRI